MENPQALSTALERMCISPQGVQNHQRIAERKNLDMTLIELENGHWADQCCVNCG